jgi:hypothetical protein
MKNYWSISVSIAFLWTAFPVSAGLSEKEYRSKYAFAVDQNPGDFADHPAGRFRVFTQFGVRECDLEEGEVQVLAFYDGDKLIRSYSLKQLFSDRESWDFHPASGVFLWLIFSPKLNGFHGQTYTVATDSGIRTFSIETGAAIKTPAEQAGTGQPATRSQSKSEGSDKPQPEAEWRSR